MRSNFGDENSRSLLKNVDFRLINHNAKRTIYICEYKMILQYIRARARIYTWYIYMHTRTNARIIRDNGHEQKRACFKL